MVNTMLSSEGRWQIALGMPVAGLLWSLATLLARSEQVDALGIPKTEAFFYISLGGMAQTLLLWVGFTGVLWAMTRAFGGQIPLLRLMSLVSAASIPLWIGAPATAFWINGPASQSAIAATLAIMSMALFLHTLARGVVTGLNWPLVRALNAVLAASVFLASFAFLAL